MRLEHQRVLDAIIENLEQHYIDPAVAHQIADALIAHQLRGDDDPATTDKDFAALLTAQMREVSRDLHLEVMYSALPPSQSSPQEFARKLESLKNDNCSFKKVQILPHNIGYLKLDAFLSPSDCGPTASAAMESLNGVNALIFDLRVNIGGTSEMVSLIASYRFDHPEYVFGPRRVPTPQSWTSSPVSGSRLANKPVYILTSSTTISGAEQFTYDLKMLKRATIVGEVTAGGAHAGVWHPIDDHLGVVIPENRAVNPYGQADRGNGEFLQRLMERGITPYMRTRDSALRKNSLLYGPERFTYLSESNSYLCPVGEQLNYGGHSARNRPHVYIGTRKRCGTCPLKAQCTTAPIKYLAIHVHELARQRARDLVHTAAFVDAQRKRKKVEALFAELKNQIGLSRLRLRRLKFVREQFLLAATAQNIKRLVRFLSQTPRPPIPAVT
jgi:hypothetical protein